MKQSVENFYAMKSQFSEEQVLNESERMDITYFSYHYPKTETEPEPQSESTDTPEEDTEE